QVWRLQGAPAFLQTKRAPSPPSLKRTPPEISAAVRAAPHGHRRTIQSLADATGIPPTSIYRYLKRGLVRRAVSRVKPSLSSAHKQRRLEFAFGKVKTEAGYWFDLMYNTIHVDEKWFNVYEALFKLYLAADEPDLHRSCVNRRYIRKVMVLAAVGRPSYDCHSKKYFSGKIGIWSIVVLVAAKNPSKNRVASTLETKNRSMTTRVYMELLLEHVFPAIEEKWPGKSCFFVGIDYNILISKILMF
ncbi:hypothetical protein JG687_00018127, partial [Phytophthora cactorum]